MIDLKQLKNKEQFAFEVPENYFDNIEKNVRAKIKRNRIIHLTRAISSLAAMLAIVFTITWHNHEPTSDLDKLLANASTKQLNSMIEMMEIDIDPLDL